MYVQVLTCICILLYFDLGISFIKSLRNNLLGFRVLYPKGNQDPITKTTLSDFHQAVSHELWLLYFSEMMYFCCSYNNKLQNKIYI